MFAADGFCTQEMTTLGLICLALFAIQIYLSDLIMRDPRRIIWTRRQTTRWKQMVRDLDFAAEIYEMQLALFGKTLDDSRDATGSNV